MTMNNPASPLPLSLLRKMARPRPKGEPCELCGASLGPEHDHLVEPATRKIMCACGACAILFSGDQATRFRRVPRDVQALSSFSLTEEDWQAMQVPINLAFFFYSSPAKRVVGLYPSPAGPTESPLPAEAWEDLAARNPVLRELQPDVEALLVNRVGNFHDYYRAPIDECYKLIGLVRISWRGLSGGTEVWRQIAQFFADLKKRSQGS